jgi:predicted PurR-regulated permease PerM
METNDNIIKMTSRLVLAILILALLVVGKSFLVPLAWSLLIALSSYRLIEWFETHTKIPTALIILLFLVTLMILISSLAYFFYIELNTIFADLPVIGMKISEGLHNLATNLADKGIVIPDHIDKSYISDLVQKHSETIYTFISSFGLSFWNIILILFYLFFLLLYRDLLTNFILARISDKRRLVVVRERIQKSVSLVKSYMYSLMMLTLILAVLNYIVFLVFGMKYALFFSIFLALLNLIPFVGNLVGLAFVMLFAFITSDKTLTPVLIFFALMLVNFLQDNVFRPWLVGDKLKLNAFTIFITIILGGMIWGVSGMILFIPVVGIMKIIIENSEKHSAYAIFFSDVAKKSKSQPVEKEINMPKDPE